MKQLRLGFILITLALLVGCDVFYNDPQAEITVIDADGVLVEGAEVQVYKNPNGFGEGLLTDAIWESEFSLQAEGVTNMEGKILFTKLVAPHYHFIRVSKGLLNNNMGIQNLGQLNMDQIVKVTIEIN
ncbi:MAG: hypothetical protein L3J06_08000 [Cyclobacteriaceae bacterium]|nr:hypothetical protein [Cyclobacteriaceae bacterium]